jgi:hypothetical protein
MNHIARLWSLLSLATLLLFGCQKETSDLDAQYGYVQFKLVKEASIESSATRATDILERLADAYKIKVVMQSSGSTITQTLPLSAYDEESAEWGVYSEKLRLLTGEYNVIGYYLYDNLDNELLAFSRENANESYITIVNNSDSEITISLNNDAENLINGSASDTFRIDAFCAGIYKTKKNTTLEIN